MEEKIEASKQRKEEGRKEGMRRGASTTKGPQVRLNGSVLGNAMIFLLGNMETRFLKFV